MARNTVVMINVQGPKTYLFFLTYNESIVCSRLHEIGIGIMKLYDECDNMTGYTISMLLLYQRQCRPSVGIVSIARTVVSYDYQYY